MMNGTIYKISEENFKSIYSTTEDWLTSSIESIHFREYIVKLRPV